VIRYYFKNVLVWLDVGLNVIFLSGSPRETISSRVGKQADIGLPWACKFCTFLAKLLGPQHCENAELAPTDVTMQWWKRIF
jgi:hypothetical protein